MGKIRKYTLKVLSKTVQICLQLIGRIYIRRGRHTTFISHVMAPEFDIKRYKGAINPYFAKWGFKFPLFETKYYEKMTGVEADHYIPFTLLSHYLIPFLNGTEDSFDKNDQRILFGAKLQNKKVEFIMPEQVVYNKWGTFYDGNDEPITPEKAVELVMAYPKDIIIKPTVDSSMGKGVNLLKNEGKDNAIIKSLFAQYARNFSFEERIGQHSLMAEFNPSSLNTTRIVTYRKPDGQIKFLFSILRFGKEGKVVDNASAGGKFAGVSPDGTINRTIKSYKTLKTEMLDEHLTEKIPYFERIKQVAIHLHGKMPKYNYLGWDFSISQEGIPILIELNLYPAIYGTQIATGPAFSKEDLEEIMPMIANWKVDFKAYPKIKFENIKGHGGEIF